MAANEVTTVIFESAGELFRGHPPLTRPWFVLFDCLMDYLFICFFKLIIFFFVFN